MTILLTNSAPTTATEPLHARADSCSFRWHASVAKNMADTILTQVRETLSQSRLIRKSERVRLIRRDEILRVDQVLGCGAFSQVSSVTTQDGRRYACKHLQQKLMSQPDSFRIAAAELACEAHMLASFDHPHILKIRGWAQNGISSFEDGWHDSFFLLLDQLDETLDQRIAWWQTQEQQHVDPSSIIPSPVVPSTSTGLSEIWRRITSANSQSTTFSSGTLPYQTLYLEKLQIMLGIADALEYLHERGVIFRDLKPNNIGFLGNRVQLFDFGLSRELPTLDTSVPFEMSGKVGTLRYMAPEVAMHQSYNVSADVYSWAMVCYEMMSLQKPFDGWTRDMHAKLVCDRGMRPDAINCVGTIPYETKVLVEHAWSSIPTNRPTITHVVTQIRFIKEQQLLISEEQQIQRQISLELHAQQQRQSLQQQQEAVMVAMCVDFEPAPHKMMRCNSFDSIETIETTSLSVDSLDF
jgi:serine/threonine protein kinase